MSTSVAPVTGEEWRAGNFRYLTAEMDRLRLLLRRRILRLRKHWRRDQNNNYLGWAITDHEADILLIASDKQAEADFYNTDPQAQELGVMLAANAAEIVSLRQEMNETGMPVALDILASRFDLSSFERDLILLCLAPELDPAFERLYAYVQDDATRKHATPHLATSLSDSLDAFGLVRNGLMPRSPLRRWRLILMEGSDSSAASSVRALRLDDRIVDYLLGANRLDERCHSVVRATYPLPLSDRQHQTANDLNQWWNRDYRNQHLKMINLIGSADSGRLAIAHELCALTGLNLLTLDPRTFQSRSSEQSEVVTLLEREALLLDLAFFLDVDSLKAEGVQSLKADIERFAAPLIVASEERFQCERDMLSVPVVRPHASEQTGLWEQALKEDGESLRDEVRTLVEQFDFGPRSIAKAVAEAKGQAEFLSFEEDVLRQRLWQACRQQSAPQLEQLAKKIVPCYEWDDIVVPAEVRQQLHEITEQVAQRPMVYQCWGFGTKLSRGRGISALFSGASGVGKTMAAEVMARHLQLDLYRIDLAGVVSKYIGETEKNLRSVFEAAERSGAILFFDEADALFGKRSEVKDSHDRYANIEVNYLLQRMEDYRGLAILATNMKATLDSAFMRRLRFIVDFPFPAAAQRREIWRRVFPEAAEVDDLDFNALSRLEIAGGNIRNIAVNAAFLAAGEGVPIGMTHVMRAARREYAKMDRLVPDSEFGRYAGAWKP
jgi:hypothetical protein